MLRVLQLENMEAAAIAIRTARRRRGSDLLLVPNAPPFRSRAVLEAWPQTVTIGDFNAKSPEWNSITTDTPGWALLTCLQNHNDVTTYGAEEPTFCRHIGRPDVLDIALRRAMPLVVDMRQGCNQLHASVTYRRRRHTTRYFRQSTHRLEIVSCRNAKK